MRLIHFLLICAVFAVHFPAAAQIIEGYDAEAAARAVNVSERDWLDYEIGAFATGREPVYAGQLKITQKDQDQIVVLEGAVLATLSRDVPSSLTILWPDAQKWVRLTQEGNASTRTQVSRLRPLHATAGGSADCEDCFPPLGTFGKDAQFLRLAAQGRLSDVKRSRFIIELSGYLEIMPPAKLSLDDILQLRPELDAWLRRPKAPFERRGREAVRKISNVLIQRAPAFRDDPMRFICNHETPYTARHHVMLNSLAKYEVRDLKFGKTDLCCVDNARHDGSKICGKELTQ